MYYMSTVTANTVADFFLHFAHEHGDCLTNLKLQKLVYYAQAWHLALKKKPLFADSIEAWIHGPVVPSLYRRFKSNKWNPISDNPKKPALLTATEKLLEEVLQVFGGYSAWQLECMTHQEAPWRNARKGLADDQNGDREIPHDEMRDFYRKLADKKK